MSPVVQDRTHNQLSVPRKKMNHAARNWTCGLLGPSCTSQAVLVLVFFIKDVVSEQPLTCALMSCPLPDELVLGVRIGSGLSTSVD